MTGLLRRLRKNQRGAAALEFALVAPALILLIVGIAQLGILFFANAGLSNAVAEGARYATIFAAPDRHPDPDPHHQLEIRPQRRQFHHADHHSGHRRRRPNYLDISASYTVPIDFIFFSAGSVTLTETRRAFVRAP